MVSSVPKGHEVTMVRRHLIHLIVLCLALLAKLASAQAVETLSCLNDREVRSAVAQGRALTLAKIKRELEVTIEGEILRVRLCERADRLVYMLTILHHDGKVRAMMVDAQTGAAETTIN